MKRIFLLLLLCAAGSALAGADITVAENGKSPFSIVYSEKVPYTRFVYRNEPQFLYYNKVTAETLQKLLAHATGAKLQVIPESKYKGGPAIFLGNTDSARKAGLIPAKYGVWEYRIDVKNGNIYLHGMEFRNNNSPKSFFRSNFVLGTHKAMLTFVEQFTGAVFAGTPRFTDGVPKVPVLKVPANYSFRRVPRISYTLTGRRDLNYDVANNGFFSPWYGTYGGHNHPIAVPTAKYFKSHPEYFAIQRGKRDPGRQNQLCLSNPDVQRLIYEEVLNHLDKGGFDMVQLAQSDGFGPCECENCQAMFGIRPKASPKNRDAYRQDPCWGEKLWILHRNYALRLKKDRPGKKVCIIAYGPTRRPPQSFKEFPDNVMIELAPYNEEIVESWKPYKVPAGFVVYLYNWGFYNSEGFMPKRNWDFCRKQAADFWKDNVQGIYCCGFGECHGLEGPTYYIWLKLLEDPKQDVQALLKRFCARIFPGAEKEMVAFYTLLNERLKLKFAAKETDWNDPALLAGKDPGSERASTGTILLRWPDKVLDELDAILKKAEAKAGKCWQLKLVRFEFNYMNVTARAVNAFAKFRSEPTAANYAKALDYMVKRDQLINGLKWNKSQQTFMDGQPLFAYAKKDQVLAGGRLRGPLYAPFFWDAQWMKAHDVQVCERTIKAGDAKGQYMIPGNYLTEMTENYKKHPIRVSCRLDGDMLKVVFIRSNTTYEEMRNSEMSVLVGPSEDDAHWFPGRFRNGSTGHYRREKTNVANKGMGDVYKGIPDRKGVPNRGRITVPAPGVSLAPGEISAEVALPLALFKKKPGPGDTWLFNATGNFQKNGGSHYTVWEYNPAQRTWRNTRDRFGKLIF